MWDSSWTPICNVNETTHFAVTYIHDGVTQWVQHLGAVDSVAGPPYSSSIPIKKISHVKLSPFNSLSGKSDYIGVLLHMDYNSLFYHVVVLLDTADGSIVFTQHFTDNFDKARGRDGDSS